jgi:hypothetical protein
MTRHRLKSSKCIGPGPAVPHSHSVPNYPAFLYLPLLNPQIPYLQLLFILTKSKACMLLLIDTAFDLLVQITPLCPVMIGVFILKTMLL